MMSHYEREKSYRQGGFKQAGCVVRTLPKSTVYFRNFKYRILKLYYITMRYFPK